MQNWTRLARFGWIFLVIIVITGCSGDGSFRPPQPTPTPIRAVVPPLEQTQQAQEAAAPVRDDEPLRFNLPTPGPAPISLWRPPLYEVPWGLTPNDHFFFTRPIAADKVNWPLADYRYGGMFYSTDIVHTGVDIPTPKGTPVLAAGPGKVIWAGWGLFLGNDSTDDPYGLAVAIRHEFGYQGKRLYTVYAHMDKIHVVNGQIVQTGDLLGEVGVTGFTTGPHLHFEVRTENNSYHTTLNPELWLAPPQGWGVLTGQARNTSGSFLQRKEVWIRNLETRQRWTVITYGTSTVHSDPYYGENMVLSDLPAGRYEITIEYEEENYTHQVDIYPGAVTSFAFRGEYGYSDDPLPTPEVEDLMPPYEP